MKSHMARRIASASLVGVLSFTLVACPDSEAQDTEENESPENESPENESPENENSG